MRNINIKIATTEDRIFVIDLNLDEKPKFSDAAKLAIKELNKLTLEEKLKIARVKIIQKEGVSIQTINTDLGWDRVYSLLESQAEWSI